MDEFFDFDQASHKNHEFQLNPPLSDLPTAEQCLPLSGIDHPQIDVDDDGLLLPPTPEPGALAGDLVLEEEMTNFENFSDYIPHVSRPSFPCDYCLNRKLHCLFLYDGQTTCSSCTALFRQCSFSKQGNAEQQTTPPDSNHLDTLYPVNEDTVADGAFTGTRPLRSSRALGDDKCPEGRSRKNNPRFPREAVRVLKTWLDKHSVHPYPTDQEKDELKKESGLKRSQISNWLANARRRGKVPQRRGASPSLSSNPGAVDIPATATPSSFQEMNPLQRWQHSPPENEPASVSAIANAVATSDYAGNRDQSSSSSSWSNWRQPSSNGSSFSALRAPSMSSLETMRSSASDSFSFGSAFSNQSQQSFGSIEALKKKDQRRRRRRSNQSRQPESHGSRMFQCTFCVARFKTKHDWQRHEKSFHLSLEKWTCAPLGGLIRAPAGEVCVYCNAINPPAGHLETHNYEQCSEKSLADRTFYRKDHLRQHLRLTHSCGFDVSMESWRSAKLNVQSRCGFCGDTFSTWQARVDHLAAHFRGGAEMRDWKGDWGIEPAIQGLLENATAPWLLDSGIQKHARPARPCNQKFKPFQQLVEPPDDGDGSHINGKCARDLERALGAWTRDRVARGSPPTDEELQDQSRLIIYTSADPWNITAADDAEWLRSFKRNNGLSPVMEDVFGETLGTFGLEQDFSYFGVGVT
ncbi:MAG: hypothetical protein M1837_002165 [Sclerophora amabilis]|nr:MAG: hypothetical protein M1837_002165 [Sclerophora amabilis]